MSEDLQSLSHLFDASAEPGSSSRFTEEVLARTNRLRRIRTARKIVIALGVALAGVPLQDLALEIAEIMLITLLPAGDGVIAQLLAPINTVGALLSAVLLGLRIIYKRLFA